MVQSGTAPIVLILRDCIYLYENVRIFPIYYVLIHTIEICNHKEKRRALAFFDLPRKVATRVEC